MSEPTTDEQRVAADFRKASKTARVGQTCITLFVMFVISLLAFGKAPLARIVGTKGSRLNFDLISCLGVAGGALALIFLLTGFKKVLRLPTAKKVLGLIGAVGLIAHAALALFSPLSYGAGTPQAVGTAGHQPLAQHGPEQWIIDGKTCKIASTYYLRLPAGLQYTIQYAHRFTPAETKMNDARALETAWPLIKHAYAHGLYKRASITKVGQGAMSPSRIGVTLFERQGDKTRGYGVALDFDQIKERIERESAPAPAGSQPVGASP